MEKYHFLEVEQTLMERTKVPFAIYQFLNHRVVTITLSKGFCDLFGYSDNIEQAYYDMDHDMYKDTHPDDAGRIADAAYRFATEGGSYDVIYRTCIPDCSGYRIIHAHGEHIYTNSGVRLAHVWYIDEGPYNEEYDVSHDGVREFMSNSLEEECFLKASHYDHLTGLPSMTYFFDLAKSRQEVLLQEGQEPIMLFMDFSGMKYFNHKNGFAAGDHLLQLFARLLAREFGNENCSRLGQDHFAAVTCGQNIEDKLRSIFEACALLNDGRTLPLHVGIYRQWNESSSVSMACDRAKIACDTLKNAYASDFSSYNASMKDAEDRQQHIIANLDKAIAEGWIKVYYQPIVRAVNGRVCDEEALARWIDPVKGFMSPGEFIPFLEEHRLIYKLDLYVVECVLRKIRQMEAAGLHLMPQSINLSRSDFDTCDIVEEIRRRVDDAGISRKLLTIEITESVIGKDFEFMKTQIDRFRELGFAVWMDDFGSGYSSLDVLQSLKFDLIKFDMRFMQSLDENESSKIILTELMKMVTSLGIDTICEGVETLEQVQFLQEAGCSKLQGYYFDKPVPLERILEKYEKGIAIGFEDPEQSQYYELIGRVNLHDLSSIAQDSHGGLDNFFNTIPMVLLEMQGEDIRFVRYNKSYRDFMMRSFNMEVDRNPESYQKKMNTAAAPFVKTIFQCLQDHRTVFLDDRLSDNTIVHFCMRHIATNQKNGTVAVAVAVLSVTDAEQGTTYANIARALAADYSQLYYVDLETEQFIEYSSHSGDDELAVERRGDNFFQASRQDAIKCLHHEDAADFISVFTKENVLRELDEQGIFTTTYRLMLHEEPVYVSMKAMRMQHDLRHLIIGVANVDAQVKQQEQLERIRRNERVYARMMALAGDYICMYTVDPVTDDYTEYTAQDVYDRLGLAKTGKDFFHQARLDAETRVFPEDRQLFREQFTKENVMYAIGQRGLYTLRYRLLAGESVLTISLRIALIKEDDNKILIVGVNRLEN